MKSIKFWWWRIWTFRKEKVKIYAISQFYDIGDTLTYGDTNRHLMYIGKDYYIPCFIATYKYP